MPPPLSWAVLQWLRDTCLAGIRVDAGYYTDAGAQVHLEPVSLDESDPYPALWVYEDDTDTIDPGQRVDVDDVQITIDCAVRGSVETAHQRAHLARADIRRALRHKPRDLPLGVLSLEVLRAAILPRAEDHRGTPYTLCQVVVRARLAGSASPAD